MRNFRRKKQTGKNFKAVVKSHLSGISRNLLDGDKRTVYLEFTKQQDEQSGLYGLYDKKGRIYYVGKTLDLPVRLN